MWPVWRRLLAGVVRFVGDARESSHSGKAYTYNLDVPTKSLIRAPGRCLALCDMVIGDELWRRYGTEED